MGNKEKKKHRHRSRSREREYKRSRRSTSADDSNYSRSRSRSRDRRTSRKKKHRHRSRSSEDSVSRSRSRDRSMDRSRDRSRNDRSRERKKKKKRKERSRSRSQSRSKRKKKRRSGSSESSEDSEEEVRRKKGRGHQLTAEDIARLKEEAKKRKELIKATETPEEKRARRMAKKEAKERKRKEQMGWDQEYMGYSNADNPFGDEHLMETFLWSKKISKEGKDDLDHQEIQQMTKSKMEETRKELEKVKKRRLEREREREEREREREQLQRDKEAEYYREWEKSEDSFHLKQAKLRSEIRIKDGRAKPIDLLAKYISAEDDELAIEMHEPYTYLYGLTITDLEDLLEDIKVYLELEQGKNTEYWRDIVTVTEDEVAKLKRLGASADFRDRRENINEAVNEEVVSVFKGKTTKQLQLLEESMRKKLAGGEGVDIGYWETLLQQLKAHMAKTRLRERHKEVLRRKLFKLKQEQGIESDPLFPVFREKTPSSGRGTPQSGRGTPTGRSTPVTSGSQTASQSQSEAKGEEAGEATLTTSGSREATAGTSEAGEGTAADDTEQPGTSAQGATAKAASDDEELITEEDLVEDQRVLDYQAGSYSPQLFAPGDIDDIDAVIYDPIDDIKKLELARKQVKSTGEVRLDEESEFVKKASEGMNDEEARFSVTYKLDQQSFLWSDKYRPRKPRFFNRVHTGFEWNKYNQTHYDIDNPPPKIVQGYKFNIFYPDLIDKSKTPEYTVTPIPENPDFAVLRFKAGPPYEDIAFKVVNKEWEHSYKKSFRCQFANNIMQLWFHFKRYRYRR